VKKEFPDFYKSMFKIAYDREGRKVAFMEYAWDMSSCDPCSADPLTPEELRKAGVFWLNDGQPTDGRFIPRRRPPTRDRVFITRIHVRYTRNKFPEDLTFKETSNNEFFQGRYVLRHPFTGEAKCEAGRQYKRSLRQRFEQEAQTLAKLTGWNIQDIRRKIPFSATVVNQTEDKPFWQNIWK
jgi:hypothetical protein